MAQRKTVLKARDLRRRMTSPEIGLWSILRARPHGLRFRRQHPIGPYVLDFYCPAARLAVEVDGMVHDMGDNPMRDLMRDRWLIDQGIDVLRIPAMDVVSNLDSVARLIFDRCALPLHHPAGGPPPHAQHGED